MTTLPSDEVRPPRKRLTKKEYAALLEKQGGVCCVVGCDSTGPFEAEHSTPDAISCAGEKPDQLMCVPCHRRKTAQDRKNIAKVNRIRKKQKTGRARKRRGRKIASRPFDQSPTKSKKKWPKRPIAQRQRSPRKPRPQPPTE